MAFRVPSRPQPYDLTYYDGKLMDWLTRAALEAVDRRLWRRHKMHLDIIQGCYQALDGDDNDVSASAGTHDGGGVVDTMPTRALIVVRVLRTVGGFWAWYRPELWRSGSKVWDDHIHAVLEGNKKLSRGAAAQVIEGKNGGDGLVGSNPDPHSAIPVIPFKWPYFGFVGRTRWIAHNLSPRQRRRFFRQLNEVVNKH